jgi:WS/DGAT/MGAT family acyltransferase
MTERMTDLEALMWTLESDAHLSSAFANLTVLDRMPDLARLRARMERALAVVPRLRQRVVPALGRLAPPEWRDDPDIDIGWHVRHLDLPAPGTERQLLDLAAELNAQPFDLDRPLWRFTVVGGLTGGRAAMVQQMHHAITDGEGGMRMSLQFIDFERDAPDPEPIIGPPDDEGGDGSSHNPITDAVDALGHLARRGTGIARRSIDEGADLLRHPDKALALAEAAGATARSVLRQATVTDKAQSPLWTARTLERRLDVLRVPLDDVKRVAKGLGGSVNDAFVTAVAGGAGAYHRERGYEVDHLRMAMPVSTREGKGSANNAFTPTRTVVSTIADPRARFEAVRQQLSVTKTERALRLVQSLAGVTNLLPVPVLVRVARAQVHSVDFTTSNVRGAPFDVYIAGARIDANYPLGPLAGTAFNATVLSVAGSLDVGVHTDAGAIDDPGALRDAIAASFDELLSVRPARSRRSRR